MKRCPLSGRFKAATIVVKEKKKQPIKHKRIRSAKVKVFMDKAIKSEKKKMDKGMDKLLKKDKVRDKACDNSMKKKKK